MVAARGTYTVRSVFASVVASSMAVWALGTSPGAAVARDGRMNLPRRAILSPLAIIAATSTPSRSSVPATLSSADVVRLSVAASRNARTALESSKRSGSYCGYNATPSS